MFSKIVALSAAAALVIGAGVASAGTASAQESYPPKHRVHRAGGDHVLTVRRRAPVDTVVVTPAPAGPEIIVTGPVHAASALVDLPFRVLGAVFPSTGTVAGNPLVLVGAPIRAAGEIAQVPFRLIEAPFTPSDPYRLTDPTVF